MNRKSFIAVIMLTALLLPGFSTDCIAGGGRKGKSPKNIILFIGDGMGTAQVYAGMTVSSHPFNIEKFPYAGFAKTFSADNYITDSAAGGTALACGTKTNNGMIGVKPDGSAVSSILEIARRNGMATGVVSTSTVTHATPASFVAHNSGRGNYEDIAKDFLNGTVDVFLGGGENHFRVRSDSADLTLELKKQGFDVVYTLDDMNKSTSSKLAGLLAEEHLPSVMEGRGNALAAMTAKAIETLSRDGKGFFLMVEGSMIDWGGHEKNIEYLIAEMIDLDEAVGVGLSYAEASGNTLVMLTADHETGGLTLNGGSITGKTVDAGFSGSGHTAVMVPVFSYGPGAETVAGIHDNTFFFGQYIKLLKLKKK